jgi:hypothetical protein
MSVIGAAAADNPDLITALPGLSWNPNFKHYSGYLNATGTKRLHYWSVLTDQWKYFWVHHVHL